MKDTNAIEKALQIKVNAECRELIDKFAADLTKLSTKYGGSSFYYFRKNGNIGDRNYFILNRMILEAHSEKMLKYKSQELIKKLDLI
jgi:hypothetical protein